MHLLDHAVVVVYLLATVALGALFSRHQSRQEFFRASSSMGVITVGLSVMATLFSSNSFVMYPSVAFGDSLKLGLTLVSHTAILPLIVWVFIPVYTRLNCQTAYEYLELRFHVSVRCLASGLFILLRIGWMAAATYAAALVISGVAGIPQITVILTLGVIAILYTMMGGLRAVMWTDVIQFFVFAATILVALGLLTSKIPGGMSAMVDDYVAGRDDVLFDFTPSLTLQYGSWAILIGIFLEALSAFGADQVAVQRYLSAKSERTSQLAFVINILGIWLVVPALLLIGVGLYSYYGAQPAELIPLVAEREAEKSADYYAAHPDEVTEDFAKHKLHDHGMPQFVKLHFPPGFKGLFLAALMAAIMSSIDSGIHSVTTALIVDFRDRLFPHLKPADDRADVRTIRLLTVGIGAAAVTLACFVGPLGSVFDIAKKLTAAFGGPLLAVFILAFFAPRVSTVAVFLGTLAAAALTLAATFICSDWFSVWFWPLGFGAAMGASLAISLFYRRSPDLPAPKTFRQVVGRTAD